MSDSQDEFDWLGKDAYSVHKIPVSTLLRWFLYDVNAEDARENSAIFNLSGVSEEGHDKETEDSDNRVDAIAELIPFLNFYANATAEYAYALNKKQMLSITGVTEEVMNAAEEVLKDFYANMTLSALVSAFASAAELRIIKLNGTHTEIKKETYE